MTVRKHTPARAQSSTSARNNRPARPKGKTRHALEARALAIVADVKGYDSDTRKSIGYMLETNDVDLAEFVERAEAGDTICDLTRIDAEQLTAAGALIALTNMPGLPDFISEALYMILGTAANLKGIGIATGEGDEADFSIKALADLFAVTTGFQRELSFVPAPRDFAEMLSAALMHPDCPSEIYNAVGECDYLSPARWDTPEFIRLALGSHEAREAQRKGGAR